MNDLETVALIRQVFADQCEDNFGEMEEALLCLEDDPSDLESIRTVFRICHTLKGDAGSLGFGPLAEFAHALEDLLDALRSQTVIANPKMANLLLESLDASRQMVRSALDNDSREHPRRDELLSKLRAASQGEKEQTAESTKEPKNDHEAIVATRTTSLTLRVDVRMLDRLLNLGGELAIAHAGLTQELAGSAPISRASLLERHQSATPLLQELQETIRDLRLVPIGPLFRQQRRLIRDVAVLEGKQVRLQTSGDDAELDTTIIDQLRDPLAHLVRNSVVHGIETPDEREAAGKPPKGQVQLRAFRDGGSILVEFEDDGRGLDEEQIRARAQELGVGGAATADLGTLIFMPGLSTKESASLSAGRGVGMDVVRTKIEAVGGSVSVETHSGRGTCFRMRLPLTVAIIDAFAVQVSEEVFLLPLSAVVECVHLGDGGRRRGRLLNVRGEALPIIRLRDLFGLSGADTRRENVVVVQHDQMRVGIAVDALEGECQAVIKPLSGLVNQISAISGVTIRGDGRVALVLDVPALLQAATHVGSRKLANGSSEPGGESGGPGWSSQDHRATQGV